MSSYRPAPNINRLNTTAYHDMALDLLEEMMCERRQNLRDKNKDESNAAVHSEEWQASMCHLFRIHESLAVAIDKALQKEGKIISFGRYRQSIPKQKPVNVVEQFFCAEHRKLKGFAFPTYQIGEQVNYTVPGSGGHVAYNRVGTIQSIDVRGFLSIQVANKTDRISKSDVTPAWAPSPLMYKSHGKCECFFEPEEATSCQ